jgi:hypothetical protein
MLFRSNPSRLGFTNSRSVPRVVWGVRLDWNGIFSSSSFIKKWPASLVLVILFTNRQPFRSVYQPPDSSTFLSERTSHQHPAATSQQYSSLRTNQHQPSATSQPNKAAHMPFDFEFHRYLLL